VTSAARNGFPFGCATNKSASQEKCDERSEERFSVRLRDE
jgi:hypothetical protein